MNHRATASTRKTVLIATAWLLAVGAPFMAEISEEQGKARVVGCEQLAPEEFDKLSDAQEIRCRGEEKTAGEIRRELLAKRERLRAESEKAQAASRAKLQELQKKYGPKVSGAEAQDKMEAARAELRQESPSSQARQKAIELRKGMQNARTPEQRAEIQAEAKEVLEQLSDHVATLCLVAGCPREFQWIPKIEGVLPFSIVSPGGPIIIKGARFGAIEGNLRMTGAFGTREMAIDIWTDGGIAAFFPSAAEIGPIFDSNLTLQVETAGGVQSNLWPLQWIQEARLLTTVNTSVHDCGKDANVNSCNWQLSMGESCSSFTETANMALDSKPPDPACPCTAVGFHGNCWGAVGDDFDDDRYVIGPLRNGWTLQTFLFQDSLPEVDSCDDAVSPLGFVAGSVSWNPEISWCVTPSDDLVYWLWVYIVGPAGFSHV